MAEDRANELEMIVDSVRVHMRTGRHVLVLRESGRGRLLMIWVGVNEANAIAMKLQGVTPERPLTHDLMVAMLDAVDVRVDRIVISDLADETFHARLLLVGSDSRHEVDARPSDAIALAVRIGAPIYATSDVLDRAATSPDDEDEDDDTGEGTLSATALEETGEPIDAARLDIFREFVNSLDLDQEGRGGPSSS
ncbi:MAG TPA: bifunctional nuclease family protein [Candidatus Limnocylindrales bacterium]|jgi:bifunctional DNase/RNase|nr:bifunctional nuclease family protein [Candidatus Limnocylindrales bacterium]